MSKRRLRMRQIKEILRLRYQLNRTQREIANASGIARSTVKDYLSRAKAAGIQWPLPDEMSNEQLNGLLFPVVDRKQNDRKQTLPHWPTIHKELKRKSVTLQVLWEEYKRGHPNGYQYSWFALLYRRWAKSQDVWMPQVHKAGEKAFVDYSGLRVPIWSADTRDVLYQAEIFVSVLGASDLIFCYATQTQKIVDWIQAHQQLVIYYQGVPELIVPDNLKAAVNKPNRYEPTCQVTYEEWAQHNGCAIMPARAYRPRDKAKAEKGVQLVQQRVLAPMRNQRFTSLEQLNAQLMILLEQLNNRHSKVYGCSRWALFNSVERDALKPLPQVPYELALWQQQRVNGGYHLCIQQHHYSVPHRYVHKKVDVRVTAKCIEVFYQDERITCHQRDDTPGAYTTHETHRPEAHRQQTLWHAKQLLSWADNIGPATQQLIQQLFGEPKRHLYQKERSALGILRLSRAYSESQLEQACQKAIAIGTCRYDSIVSILKRHRTLVPSSSTEQPYQTPEHSNVRGAQYYH